MLKLYAENLRPLTLVEEAVIIAIITNNPNLPKPVRHKHILLLKDPLEEIPKGFPAVLVFQKDCSKIPAMPADSRNIISIPDDQEYLMPGDVVRLNLFDLSLRSIYRINSKHNSLLLTERCNHFCLMCSQPPRKEDDGYIVNELLQAIPLMSRSTREIGITGGEPTLLGSRFIDILRSIKNVSVRTLAWDRSAAENVGRFHGEKRCKRRIRREPGAGPAELAGGGIFETSRKKHSGETTLISGR